MAPVGTEDGASDRSWCREGRGDALAGGGVPDPRGVVDEAVTTRRPSGLKAAARHCPGAARGAPTGLPVAASQTRAVPSSEAVTTRRPSGLKAAALTRALVLQGRARHPHALVQYEIRNPTPGGK